MFPFKRMAAAGLAVSMALSISVCAAAPTPTYDESYYVNLDYYGVSRSSNIVKSFLLNGQNSITDYGSYESIENMSNYIEPCRSDEGVTFTFEDQTSSRFYFEAKTDEPLTNLPWSVSLSYKLNGVPTDPAALAGAKGLVEITLDLIPNQAAPEYFRNNLVLTAATTLDCDTIYSVEAPGAQVQTVGNFKAIAFMAMPGEECHFVTRLGSDSFEFGGFTFLMVPATLSQMEQIKDIKEAKDTLEDSANAISKSLDVILGTMGSLSGSLNATADGLAALEQGRKVISDGKVQIYANLDQSLLDLDNIGSAMKPTEGDIKAAKETLSQVKKDLSSINATTLSLKENIASTTKVLKGIKTDTDNLQDFLDDLHVNMDRITKNMNSLASSLDGLNVNIGNVDDSMNAQKIEVVPGVYLTISEVKNIISTTNTLKAKSLNEGIEDTDTAFQAYLLQALNNDANKTALFFGIWSNQKEINKELAPLTTVTGGLNDVSTGMASAMTQTSTLLKSLTHTYKVLDDDYSGLGSSLADDGVRLSDEGIKALEKLDTSISQLDALYQTLNAYEPKAQSALDTAATLANALTTGTLNAKTLFSNSEALLKQSGSFLDPGTAKTLNGAIESLRRTTKGLNQTGTIQHAKDTVKQTIDDKWDEYTGESSNLLLMDTSSVKPSLTSSRNASPETIQILMRSDEITLERGDEKEPVDESYVAEGTVFSRIGSIFHAIGRAISGIFS
jgi:putative membrane protein